MQSLTSALIDAVGSDAVLNGREATARLPAGHEAAILLLPFTTEQVSRALAVCHAAHQPVVPQGGLTGLADGAVARSNEVALSLSRMRRVGDVDRANRCLTVEAGVPLEVAQAAAREAGLMFALDLGARGSATIGGNVATNAGGNRVVRYGMMREMVLGLEAVLADGTIVDARRSVIKDNAGYDLKQLFIGTEGTLGVVTSVVLRLRSQPKSQEVALVAIDDYRSVVQFLGSMQRELGGTLSAFEVMWRPYYVLVTSPPAKGVPILSQEHSYYVLVESSADIADAGADSLLRALAEAQDAGLLAAATVAQSEAQKRQIWALRDDVAQVQRHGKSHAYDVSLPLVDMDAYVERVERALRSCFGEHRCYAFGHLGDGNLHLAVHVPAVHDAREVDEIIYGRLPPGSSISAEHGVGLLKKVPLAQSRSAAELALMRTIKAALDPRGILNPGRIIDFAPLLAEGIGEWTF